MYFFKVEISSFDDEAQTVFIVPEQNADEQGVPFDEKILTQTAEFKQFVKDTQTCMVDGKYTQYKTDEVLESLDEQRFEQLSAEGKIEEIDSNTFSISTKFNSRKSGKKDVKTYALIGGAAVLLILLLIASMVSGGANENEVSKTTETVETSSAEIPETADSNTFESADEPPVQSGSESTEFVDEPVPKETNEPTEETTVSGYSDSGYSDSSSSSGESGIYTISFNANGGTGQLSRAEVKYGDSVPLPTDISVYKDGLYLSGWAKFQSAKTALESLSMPAENLTLYAVWSEKKPTAKITLHYDDKVQVIEAEIGSTLNMLDDFGVSNDGQIVSGWYFENSPVRIENLEISENCDVYAKWQSATYITITVDRSYLNKNAETYKIPCDMTGAATLKLPVVDDKNDIYNNVPGCGVRTFISAAEKAVELWVSQRLKIMHL